MKAIFLPLLFFSQIASAQCVQLQPKSVKVEWSAYKTPLRLSVPGEFKRFNLQPKKSRGGLEEILLGSTIEIESSSVNTGSKARDKRLTDHFFTHMGDALIKARIKKVKKRELALEVRLGKKMQTVPLLYEYKSQTLKAHGYLDLLDFALAPALSELTKACFALHEGKTWSDIEIGFTASFKPCSP